MQFTLLLVKVVNVELYSKGYALNDKAPPYYAA